MWALWATNCSVSFRTKNRIWRSLGDVIAANSTAALSFRDQSSAEETLRGLKAEPNILNACLYAQDGTLFATYTRNGGSQSCPATVPLGGSATFEYRRLTLSRSVVFDGQKIGTLCLQADVAPEVLAYLKRAASIVLSVTAASLLAALFLSRKLQHVISEPMRGLVMGTQELAGGNLSARVTVTSSDEFGELARAFNEMAGSLQHSQAEILNYQQTLEQRVKDRTIELEKEIAERKQAEEELKFKNIILSTQQEASIDGILVVDENTNILSFNHRFVEVWGVPTEVIEKKVDEVLLQFVAGKLADPQSFLRRVRYLYEHRQETSRDEIILKDGRTFDRYSAPMFGSDDRYYGRVWYFRDITERRHAEEALRQSEERFRSLAASATDAIIMIDSGGNVSFWNEAAERTFGYSSQEVIGRDAHTLLRPRDTMRRFGKHLPISARLAREWPSARGWNWRPSERMEQSSQWNCPFRR